MSSAGGFVNAVINGRTLGANAIQLHPAPPQRWNTTRFSPGYEEAFLKELPTSGIAKIFFHGIYLINLATPDPRLQKLSIDSLTAHLDLMERIHGDGVIFHVGSLKDEPSEEEGYRRAAECINKTVAAVPGTARLLLEVAAGSGSIIGDRLEELAAIYEQVEHKERVAFALDTQHLWASGYDIANGLEGFIEDTDRLLGLERVVAIHVNDSMTTLGSRRDRHANLGEGTIGLEALSRFINHPALARIPMILETPALKEMETAKDELERLRSVIEGNA